MIEGIGDGASSFVNPLAGHYADRTGRGKGFLLAGYVVTCLFSSAVTVAASWPVVLVVRSNHLIRS